MPTLQPHIGGQGYRGTTTPRVAQFSSKPVEAIIGMVQKKNAYDQRVKLLEESNRVNKAKISTQKQVLLLDEQYAGNETNYEDGWYEEQLGQIKTNELEGLQSETGRQAYTNDTELLFTKSRINATAGRTTTEVNKAKAETPILLSGMVGDKKTRYAEGNDLINRQKALGVYSETEAEQVKRDTVIDWENTDANVDINASESLIKRLAKPQEDPILSLLSNDEIKELRYDANATHKAQSDAIELSKASNGAEFLGRTEFKGTPDQISSQIDQHIEWGDITKKEGNAVRGAMAQARGVGNATDVPTHANLLENINALDTRISEKAMEDQLNYIQRSNGVFSDIHQAYADKKLSWGNYQNLLTTARTATASKDSIISYESVVNGDNQATNKDIRDRFLASTNGNERRTDRMMVDYLDRVSKLKNPDNVTERNGAANDLLYSNLKIRRSLANDKIRVALDTFKLRGQEKKKGFDISVEKLAKEKTKTVNGIIYKWDGGLWQPQQ